MRMELADIGKTIRAERQSKALTQSRLAEMAGVSRATLNGLEKGTIKELGFLRLHRIMSILGYELRRPGGQESESSPEILRRMARRYVWWQSPADAVKDSRRIIAQVMDIGTLEDFQHSQRRSEYGAGRRAETRAAGLVPPEIVGVLAQGIDA
jgi:transcriptional regulator with XRE-family HTH domain